MEFAGRDPTTETVEQQARRAWLMAHRELADDQRSAFGHDKDWLQRGANNRHIIVVHDFSQVATTQHNYQDYILMTHERAVRDH